MDVGCEENVISDRRRMQNRLAQRRFREKRTQNKGPRRAKQATRQGGATDITIDPLTTGSDDCCLSNVLNDFSIINEDGVANNDSSAGYDSNTGHDYLKIPCLDDMDTQHWALEGGSSCQDALPACSRGSGDRNGGTLQRMVYCDTSERFHSGDDDTGNDGFSVLDGRRSSTTSAGYGWQSPLHMAAQEGHDRIVRILLGKQTDCNERDSQGLTPLIYAVIGGHGNVVDVLVAHGVLIGRADNRSRSALHWAILHKHEAILNTLLSQCMGKAGLIDSYDMQGKTPLHLAIEAGYEAGVQILLDAGADANCKSIQVYS